MNHEPNIVPSSWVLTILVLKDVEEEDGKEDDGDGEREVRRGWFLKEGWWEGLGWWGC